MSSGGPPADVAQPQKGDRITHTPMTKPPLAPLPPPSPRPVADTPFSLDGFLANFSGVPATLTREAPGQILHNGLQQQGDASIYAPFASQHGDNNMLDFFFSGASPGTSCVNGVASDLGIGCVSGSGNGASPGNLIAGSSSGESGGGSNFDLASFFLQTGQGSGCSDDSRRATGGGVDGCGTDARGSSSYSQCGGGDVARNARDEDALPAADLFRRDDSAASATAHASLFSPSTAWDFDSATDGGCRRASSPPRPQPPSPPPPQSPRAEKIEALTGTPAESGGRSSMRSPVQNGDVLMSVKSSKANVCPIDKAGGRQLSLEPTSTRASDQPCTLAAALAAASSSSDLIAHEEVQRTATPALPPTDVQETVLNGGKTRYPMDHGGAVCKGPDDLATRNVAVEGEMVALAHSRESSSYKFSASLPDLSSSPGAGDAAAADSDASVAPAATSLLPSPGETSLPPKPPLPTPHRCQPSLPAEMTFGDATGMALRQAISEAEEVWSHGLDMGWVNSLDAPRREAGMSFTDSTSSSSSDAFFFAETARLQQQSARLSEECVQSTASLQALTSDLLRILGPHAALSSLVGKQYAKTPLVHLQWALIEVLEGLLGNDDSTDERSGDALMDAEIPDKPQAAPYCRGDTVPVRCSSGHDA